MGGWDGEGVEEFLVNAAEAAVAEDCDEIAGFGVAGDPVDDFLEVLDIPSVAAVAGDVGGEALRVEAVVCRNFVEVRDGGDDGEIGEGEGFGEFVLENGAAGGVGGSVLELGVDLEGDLHGGGGVVGRGSASDSINEDPADASPSAQG